MPIEQPAAYRSKIDPWLIPILWMPPVAAVVSGVASALAGSTSGSLISVAMGVFVVALYGVLVFPMRYSLSETDLVVRFGICRRRIPLAQITDVHPTSNPLSAPALSLDRLRIRFGQGFFKSEMISPADRDQFLAELAQKAGLNRDGERLFRV